MVWVCLLNKTKKLAVEEVDMYIEKWKQELIQYQGIANNDNLKGYPIDQDMHSSYHL